MIRSDLCDYSKGYLVVKRTIASQGNSSSNSEKTNLKNLH